MGVSTFNLNYSGKKADLYNYVKNGTESHLGIFSGNTHASKIAGPLKAAQNYTRVMLTQLGERRENPNLGTNFIKELSSSTLHYPIQIEHIFSRNTLYALSFLKGNYSKSTQRDESIKRVSLLSFSRDTPTSINFLARMEFESGQGLVVTLPVRA